jgi:hypothetical protein
MHRRSEVQRDRNDASALPSDDRIHESTQAREARQPTPAR